MTVLTQKNDNKIKMVILKYTGCNKYADILKISTQRKFNKETALQSNEVSPISLLLSHFVTCC
jgi:hypothetical protein